MKKEMKKIILVILCLSILLPVGVFAASKIKITKKTYIRTGSGSNIVAKFKSNKGYAYCITPGKTGPSVGTTLTAKNTIKSGGLVYLLDKAGTSDSSFMVTQLAVWKYANNFKKGASSSNWSKANKLVNEAKKNSKYTTTPSVGIKVGNSSLSESGSYYKSSKITITTKNIKKDLKVKLVDAPSGAKLVDSKGNKKTSFKNGDVFYVYVPTSKISSKTSFKVKISGTGYNTYIERYKSSNSKLQELLVLIKETKKVSSSVSLTITPVVRKCQYYNGKYYGKDGKVVDKTTYSLQCEKHTCEKVGDKYFGKNGTEVDKITFTKECEKHVCEIVDGTYFGKDGDVVDSKTYSKECEKHVCEVVDDTYFGKDGTEVDSATYDKECNKHVCEIVDDTYFGKNGTEVDSATYDKECNKHVCELVDDTYFGINGNVVDEATYKDQCEAKPAQVIVPDTADFNGLLYILIGTFMIGSTVAVLNTLSKSHN